MLENSASLNSDMAMPRLASGRKKRWSYSSLFFSLFFFVPLLLSMPLPSMVWITQLSGYGLFITLYVQAINKPKNDGAARILKTQRITQDYQRR